AAAEVEPITASLAEHSRVAAQRFVSSLGRAELQLAQFPNSGAPGPLPDARRLIVGDYILSYRRHAGDVEIFAVPPAPEWESPAPARPYFVCLGAHPTEPRRIYPREAGFGSGRLADRQPQAGQEQLALPSVPQIAGVRYHHRIERAESL